MTLNSVLPYAAPNARLSPRYTINKTNIKSIQHVGMPQQCQEYIFPSREAIATVYYKQNINTLIRRKNARYILFPKVRLSPRYTINKLSKRGYIYTDIKNWNCNAHTQDPTQIDHLIKPIQGGVPPKDFRVTVTNGNFRWAHRGELQQKQTAASEWKLEATLDTPKKGTEHRRIRTGSRSHDDDDDDDDDDDEDDEDDEDEDEDGGNGDGDDDDDDDDHDHDHDPQGSVMF